MEEAGDWVGDKKMIKFAFGNTHSDVVNPKNSRSKTGTKNSHRWTMFVVLNGDNAQTAKYIKSVTYHLHPTFKPSVIKIEEAPFLLARVGWGYFEIQMDVEFQEWTGMPKAVLHHELCFEERGRTSSIIMEISEQASKIEIAKEMSKAMEKLEIEEKKNRYTD